jgi:hypothetical protein
MGRHRHAGIFQDGQVEIGNRMDRRRHLRRRAGSPLAARARRSAR